MFGNHPLPNIAPSLLCLSPPPPHIPPPPFPLPLANARTGQARARSSRIPVCAPPLVEGCGQATRHVTAQVPPPCRSLPTATPDCHVTGNTACVRHVTAATACHPLCHCPNTTRTPRHGRRRPHTLRHSQRHVRPPSPLPTAPKSTRWSEEDRERGVRRQGKGR